MDWGSTGGGGVGTGVGSPEHGRADETERDRRPSPDSEPPKRPSCLMVIVATVGILALVLAGLWLVGQVVGWLG